MTNKKIDAGCELYSTCLKKAKEIVEGVFGKPRDYFDAERTRVISVANTIFEKSIGTEDIEELAEDIPELDYE